MRHRASLLCLIDDRGEHEVLIDTRGLKITEAPPQNSVTIV
jgi:hypothetical protein